MSDQMGVPFLNLGTAGIINVGAIKRIQFRKSDIILPGANEPGLQCIVSYVDGENQELNHQESVVLYNHFAIQGLYGREIQEIVQRSKL